MRDQGHRSLSFSLLSWPACGHLRVWLPNDWISQARMNKSTLSFIEWHAARSTPPLLTICSRLHPPSHRVGQVELVQITRLLASMRLMEKSLPTPGIFVSSQERSAQTLCRQALWRWPSDTHWTWTLAEGGHAELEQRWSAMERTADQRCNKECGECIGSCKKCRIKGVFISQLLQVSDLMHQLILK